MKMHDLLPRSDHVVSSPRTNGATFVGGEMKLKPLVLLFQKEKTNI
jgi:hypothetical protein